jgi:hypothetical protein
VVIAVRLFFQKPDCMPLLYIHHTSCVISPQQSFPIAQLDQLKFTVNNKLEIIEPGMMKSLQAIMRRMGKAIRIGVGSAMPLLKHSQADGIIIGTAKRWDGRLYQIFKPDY